jgi:hypothetical protein
MSKITRILLDADSLLYRCGFAAEGEDVANSLQNLKSQIQKIKEALDCEEMDIFIKGKGNFRNEIAQTTVYKGTRAAAVPTHYRALRDYIIKVHGAREVDGMEADDAASIELWKNRDADSGVILAAMDKDLWNTPGWHFNYDPRKWRVEYVSAFQANRNFIKQLLSGDRTDNVPGLPYFAGDVSTHYGVHFRGRVGEKKAQSFVEACSSNKQALARVWDAYLWYGKEEGWSEVTSLEYFVEQGRLLWMTRELNPDGTPKLWEPPEFILDPET